MAHIPVNLLKVVYFKVTVYIHTYTVHREMMVGSPKWVNLTMAMKSTAQSVFILYIRLLYIHHSTNDLMC